MPTEQESKAAFLSPNETQTGRFRFEAENRFCLIGYSSTVIVLVLALLMGLDGFSRTDLAIYAGLTLGYHLLVQAIGTAGFLHTRKRNHTVQRFAMIVWLISFVFVCSFVSELRPVLLVGSFLTLNFYVGRGLYQQSIGLSLLITLCYLSPAVWSLANIGTYEWWSRDIVFVAIFLISSLHAATVAKHNGQLRKAVHDAKTVTEQMNRELIEEKKKVEELAAMRTRFFQNISHELRTPLTLILNPLAEVQTERPDDERVDMAINNSRRLLRLVNQLLDFQKLEAGKHSIDLTPVDLQHFVGICGDYFKSACSSKSIQFAVSHPETQPPPFMMGGVDALEKILFNYLSNALKYTPVGGSIELCLTTDERRAKLSVRDSGGGIAPENQHKLFEVFSQVEGSTTREYEGTGLGLALVKSLAEQMAGSVGVESELGSGSIFWAEFPLCHPPQTQEQQRFEVKDWLLSDVQGKTGDATETAESQVPEGDGDLILVVDDLADMRELITRSLEREGHRVVPAANGRVGLERAKELHPNLIITDWMMPDMSGTELIEALKSDDDYASIPVILLTAKTDAESKLMGTHVGADAFLGKPFNGAELTSQVQNLLRLKLSEKELKLAHAELKRSSESALKKALDKAEKANQLKGELLANLSHEFRTPLNAIINVPMILRDSGAGVASWRCAECNSVFEDETLSEVQQIEPQQCPDCGTQLDLVFLERTMSPFEFSRFLDRCQGAGEYLYYCFDNIMKMSLLERNEVEIDRTEADLQQLISQVITTFSNRAKYRVRRLHSELDSQASHVLADFNRISEVLTHLVDNALRFSEPSDEVVIRGELSTPHRVRISVIDLGSGIPESARQQIFESFQQADTSHTRDHGGLGLGLSLAAGIVALHDSTLELSTVEGQGATFSFELPKVDKPS